VKPDNILVNWTSDGGGKKTVSDVALGDFDIAFKSEGGKARETPYAIGNAMWRSPEEQTARSVTKASDVFSFGLVASGAFSSLCIHTKHYLQCIYALGAGDLLVLNDYQALVESGVEPEQEILHRHFLYFGPLPEGLLTQVKDEVWCDALRMLSEMAEATASEDPGVRFENLGDDIAPNITPEAKKHDIKNGQS